MKQVQLQCENIQWQVPAGTTLSCALSVGGFYAETPCSGLGLCGRCLILAAGELMPPMAKEAALLKAVPTGPAASLLAENPGWQLRMACLARVLGPVRLQRIRGENLMDHTGHPFSHAAVGSPDVCRRIDRTGRKDPLEHIYFEHSEFAQRPVSRTLCGIAVSIGTSFITAYRIDLETGAVLGRSTCVNPQILHGGDAATRIRYTVENRDGIPKLQLMAKGAINTLIRTLTDQPADLYRMTIAGSAAMLNILAGIDTHAILKPPFEPPCFHRMDRTAASFGIDIHPNATVTLLPSGRALIGAGTLAGMAAREFHTLDETALFLDLGTQTEIVLLHNGRLTATAVDSGPALEGMNIACGGPPIAGAIEAVSLSTEGALQLETVDDLPPNGICGSGILALAGLLIRKGVISGTGKLNSSAPHPLAKAVQNKRFMLTDTLFLGQRDIRNLQLAKSAVTAGILLLLREQDIPMQAVSQLVVSGDFGPRLSLEDLKSIGLVPESFNGIMDFAGNGAVGGASLALVNSGTMDQLARMAEGLTPFDAMHHPEFHRTHIKNLGFPPRR